MPADPQGSDWSGRFCCSRKSGTASQFWLLLSASAASISFLDCSISQFLFLYITVLRTAIVVFADLLSFQQCFYFVVLCQDD